MKMFLVYHMVEGSRVEGSYFDSMEDAVEFRSKAGGRIEEADVRAADLWRVTILSEDGQTRKVYTTMDRMITLLNLARLLGQRITVESITEP